MNTPIDSIAWRVTIKGIKLIVFSATESGAIYKAFKNEDEHWDSWPSIAPIERAPEYDKSYLRHRSTLAFDE